MRQKTSTASVSCTLPKNSRSQRERPSTAGSRPGVLCGSHAVLADPETPARERTDRTMRQPQREARGHQLFGLNVLLLTDGAARVVLVLEGVVAGL